MDHRLPDPSEILTDWRNQDWREYATTPPRYDDPSRLIGADRLTGTILERRVALEACRADA
jgi:hypothetical protein